MAFINEFVPAEDIEKYDLNGIWDKYHPASKGKYYLGFPPAWTIDRDRNVFLLSIPELARDREEASVHQYLLWWHGAHVTFEITSLPGSSAMLSDSPFKKIWKLVSLYLPEGFDVPREEVIGVLKEALTAYGYRGIHRQIPNTIIEFKF
jgi:hypothetical protein